MRRLMSRRSNRLGLRSGSVMAGSLSESVQYPLYHRCDQPCMSQLTPLCPLLHNQMIGRHLHHRAHRHIDTHIHTCAHARPVVIMMVVMVMVRSVHRCEYHPRIRRCEIQAPAPTPAIDTISTHNG